MVELVDTHALGACAARREGSSPFIRTKLKYQQKFCLTKHQPFYYADVAELVDALASGASARSGVEVQVLSSAPKLLDINKNSFAKLFFAFIGDIFYI